MTDKKEIAMRKAMAFETLAELHGAIPIDGADDACTAIWHALERMADDLADTQPTATATIARYRNAAETVRTMLDDLQDEMDL